MHGDHSHAARSPAEATAADDRAMRPLATPTIAHLGLEERIAFLLDRMVDLVGADGGVVLLLDESGDELIPRAWVGHHAASAAERSYCLGEGLVGIVARDQSPAVIHDIQQDPSPAHADLRSRGARSVAALPLKAGDRLLGIVQVRFGDPRDLDSPDVHRLTAIADHIAALAETARLYEESQARTAELERANEELRQLDRLKGDFLSMISHELRTPLTAIIGYNDLLLRQVHGSLNERQQLYGAAVKKAAYRLLALINDLLDVTRLECGQIELKTAPVRLEEVFARATDEVQPAAEQAALELRLDIPLVLPPVMADLERLHQVLINLLDNAIKFTRPGGTITVRAERTDDAVRICAIDTGVGVPKEQLERIWDRFHQADSSAGRHFGGTGLGLAIVRQLVEMQGGTVEARSAGPGTGSSFGFTLPVATAEATEPSRRGGVVAGAAGG